MRNRPLLIAVAAFALVVLAGAGWYLASPLFINRTVDEAFPFEAPSAAALEQMSADEVAKVEADFVAAIPSAEEVEKMPANLRAQIEEKVMAVAAMMPEHPIDEATPERPTVLVQGDFRDADSFHKGSGTATLYELPDGSHVLRFDDFQVTNGPDLHVLLTGNPNATDHDSLGEYVDLGSLKGNIGGQNYEISGDVDVSAYRGVVIYCLPFRVVFATAELQ